LLRSWRLLFDKEGAPTGRKEGLGEIKIIQRQRKKKKRCMPATKEGGHLLRLAGGGIG